MRSIIRKFFYATRLSVASSLSNANPGHSYNDDGCRDGFTLAHPNPNHAGEYLPTSQRINVKGCLS